MLSFLSLLQKVGPKFHSCTELSALLHSVAFYFDHLFILITVLFDYYLKVEKKAKLKPKIHKDLEWIELEVWMQPRGKGLHFQLFVRGDAKLLGGSDGKESACSVGDPSLISESGISPEEGNGNPLQHSCQENSLDRGTWKVIDHEVTKSLTQLKD